MYIHTHMPCLRCRCGVVWGVATLALDAALEGGIPQVSTGYRIQGGIPQVAGQQFMGQVRVG